MVTFVRAYVNQHHTQMYKMLFQQIFQTIEELTNQPIHWQHIDKTGFGCVVMDMNSRLVEGMYLNILGLYYQYINMS